MLAYHGDPKIKAKYLRRVRAHARADRLIQGTGWDTESRRGCAVGCTLESYDHSRYPVELGVPVELAYLEDAIFEGLEPAKAKVWPALFLSSIKPGADLDRVWHQWAAETLREDLLPIQGVQERADIKEAIERVAGLHCRARTAKVTNEEWAAAAAAAAAAARAAGAAAWVAAEAAAWDKMAARLIRLLKST